MAQSASRKLPDRSLPVAGALYAAGLIGYLTGAPRGGGSPAQPLALAAFVLLAGSYLALGVDEIPALLRRALARPAARFMAGPLALWLLCIGYAAAAALPVAPRALVFGIYLAVPTALLASGAAAPRRLPWRELLAAASLGLAIKYHLLPTLPIPAPNGFDASRLIGLVAGFYLFLVARALDGVGYTWRIGGRDLGAALLAFVAFALLAVPIGLATGLLSWQPKTSAWNLLINPFVVYLVTAVPEEFLFRGLIQNLLSRWLGATAGLAIAAVIFGLSHLPDPRYAFLATLAGAAYGWVYLRTGKITASAVTHALVDAVWLLLLRR